jgi:hypothetical protein
MNEMYHRIEDGNIDSWGEGREGDVVSEFIPFKV